MNKSISEIMVYIGCLIFVIAIVLIGVVYDIIYYKEKLVYIIDSNGIIQKTERKIVDR